MSMYQRAYGHAPNPVPHGTPEKATGNRKKTDWGEGRTKQAFKDETDINRIMEKFQVTGTISHLNKYEAQYGDFSEFDFFGAQLLIARGQSIFDTLPAETRREFANDPGNFFAFVNDPENKDRLAELLPAIAKPGKYFPDPSPGTPPRAPLNAPLEADPPPADPPESPPE